MSASDSMRHSTTVPAAPSAKVRKGRLLVPKEHGAYFQLGVPLVTAFAMGRPNGSACLFALSAVAAFLGHESLLVLIGTRGTRAAREEGRRAARWLLVLGTLAVASGAAAWATAPLSMSLIPLLTLGMAAVVGGLIARRIERTTIGEILVGAALSSASVPVAWATGVDPLHVFTAWLTWIIVAGAQTSAVRSIIQSKKRQIFAKARVAPIAMMLTAAVAMASQWSWAALATGPSVVLAIAWIAVPPDPRHLRRIGWALAAATLAASAILVVSVRG
jgi:uncharacterized membrane protein YoaK (UPF0700 family)